MISRYFFVKLPFLWSLNIEPCSLENWEADDGTNGVLKSTWSQHESIQTVLRLLWLSPVCLSPFECLALLFCSGIASLHLIIFFLDFFTVCIVQTPLLALLIFKAIFKSKPLCLYHTLCLCLSDKCLVYLPDEKINNIVQPLY